MIPLKGQMFNDLDAHTFLQLLPFQKRETNLIMDYVFFKKKETNIFPLLLAFIFST